jgi:hypothetical protein
MLNSQDTELTPKKYLTSLSLIHLTMLIGQLLFGALAIFINDNITLDLLDTDNKLFFIIPLFALVGYFAGNFLFKQNINTIANNNNSLNDKLKGYQVALIIKLALLEGSAIFGIVAFLMSGNLYFLLVVGAIIFYFFIQKPSKEKIIDVLKLKYEHKVEFEKSDHILK